MTEGKPFTNAVIGAIVTIVASPLLPLAPLAGGTVSGYLEGGDNRNGMTVGAMAGLIAYIPLFTLLVLLGNLFAFFLIGGGGTGSALIGGAGLVVVIFVALAGFAYVVLLSLVGGFVGSYLNAEYA